MVPVEVGMITVGEVMVAVGEARIAVGEAEMSANSGSIKDSSVGMEVMFPAMSARLSKEFIILKFNGNVDNNNIMKSIHSYHTLKRAIF